MGDLRLIRATAVHPFHDDDIEVRTIQPYQAVKTYQCPGCNGQILPGTGHVVVVPREAPDLRRHWHRSCWDARHRRRPNTPRSRRH